MESEERVVLESLGKRRREREREKKGGGGQGTVNTYNRKENRSLPSSLLAAQDLINQSINYLAFVEEKRKKKKKEKKREEKKKEEKKRK